MSIHDGSMVEIYINKIAVHMMAMLVCLLNYEILKSGEVFIHLFEVFNNKM